MMTSEVETGVWSRCDIGDVHMSIVAMQSWSRAKSCMSSGEVRFNGSYGANVTLGLNRIVTIISCGMQPPKLFEETITFRDMLLNVLLWSNIHDMQMPPFHKPTIFVLVAG